MKKNDKFCPTCLQSFELYGDERDYDFFEHCQKCYAESAYETEEQTEPVIIFDWIALERAGIDFGKHRTIAELMEQSLM